MKHLIHTLLIIACAWGRRASAQTPYDSFAPETSRPMLGVAEHEVKTDSILCAVVTDTQNQMLLLVDVSNGQILATAPITDDLCKWLSVDPMADDYPGISPYAYCGWNPVRFIDPDGRDIYRYDKETGDIKLYKETDDNFDQFGKFKYNRKTGEYEPRTNKYGSIKTYTDHRGNNDKIAKGILRDGLNIKQDGAMFLSNNDIDPSIDDYFNFALILDEVAGVEISGYVFEAPGEKNRKIIRFEPYKGNSLDRSKNRIMDFAPYSVLQHFHTHGHADTYIDAITPSSLDLNFKNDATRLWPDIQLLILHNYGLPFRY